METDISNRGGKKGLQMKKIEKKNIGMFFLMLGLLLAVVIPLLRFTGGQKYYDKGVVLDRHWDVTINGKTYTNVTLSKFTFPMTKKGDVVILSHHMTEHYKGVNPVLQCEFIHAKVEVHMNDTLIYSYGQKDFKQGKMLGYGVHYIEFPNDYLGKTLSITLTVSENNAFNGISSMLLGNEGTLIQESLVQNRFRLAVSMSLIVFGILMAGVSMVASIQNRAYVRLFWVALFSLLIGGWTLCNNNLIIYFTQNLKVKAYMEFLTLYAGALPLLLYFYPSVTDKTRKRGFRIFYQILLAAQIVFFVFAFVMQQWNLIHLPQELNISHALMMLEVVFIILIVVDDIRCRRKYDRMLQIGMIAILIVILFELVQYNIQKFLVHFTGNKYTSSVCYGALFIVVALLLDYTRNISRGLYQQAQQHLLENMAYSDELTGLSNRRKCDEVVEKLLDKDVDFTLISMDLNLLKYYNDTYGHEKGDLLLRSFASVLTEAFPEALTIARVGGDEFHVVLPDMKQEALRAALTRLLQCLYEKNEQDKELHLSTAVGCVQRSEFSKEADIRMLYQEADRRMYAHKQKMKKKEPELYRR